MSLSPNLLKKSAGEFLRKRKKWLIALSVFIGFLIGLNIIINHYVDKVVGTLIKEFVHEKSNGFYKVEFDEISYILFNGRFLLRDFSFDIHPDLKDTIDFKTLEQSYIYTASIPKLHIDIIDFWSVFVNRKLRVIGIEIVSPEIKIINLNKNKVPKKISFEAENLYEVLSGHLNELKINDFLISNGEFDYETFQGPDYEDFKIKGVTFEVKNFKVNEEASARKDKFFYTDNISLEIKDQILFLKDSLHKVTFDKFYISTNKNELGFENFKLARREHPFSNKKKQDHYDVSLPKLRLSGIDFVSAYNKNLLMVDSISIVDPIINIIKRTQKPQSGEGNNQRKSLDISSIFQDYVMIDHFNLSEANLIYTDETKNQAKTYSIDHISVYMTNVKLDTGNNSKYAYGFDFDKLDLIIKDYEVTLPDSLNTMKFSEFTISSNPFEARLKNLNIQPGNPEDYSGEKSRLYANFPYVVISEFDVAKAINRDSFIIKELYLENPDIRIIPASSKNSRDKKTTPGGLFGVYSVLQSFSDLFILNRLNIENGKFKIMNSKDPDKTDLSINQLGLTLDKLIVDSLTNTKSDIFGSAELNLSLNNSQINLPMGSVDIGTMSFSSNSGKLKIDDLNLTADPTFAKQKVEVNFPELMFTGINPNQIIFDNKVVLDTLEFTDVKILIDILEEIQSIKDDKKPTPDPLPVITINHVIGNNYEFDFRKSGLPVFMAEDIDFNISKFVIDQSLSDKPINQFDYDKINLISISNYDFYLAKQQHILNVAQISWEGRTSTFSLQNILLQPYGNPNNKYRIEVPEITMSGIDLKGILKGTFYIGDEILIEQPKINLKLAEGEQENLTSLDLGFIPILLRNNYLGAKANTFHVRDASINFHQKTENDSLIVEAQNLSLLVDNFEVDSTTKMLPDRFLFANDVILQGDYLTVYHQSSSDFSNINHYFISTKEGDIQLDGIYHATNTKNEFAEKDKTKLTIEDLVIKDFDFFNLTQNRKLDVSEILIGNAQFSLSPGTENMILKNRNNFLSDSLLFTNIADIFKKDKGQFLNSQLNENPNKTGKEIISDSLLLNNIELTLRNTLENSTPSATEEKDEELKTKEFALDTLLLKSINIDRILISDSKISIEKTNELKTGLSVPNIWLLAEGVKYDQVSALDSSRIFYSDNLSAKFTNINYILPDNLLSVRIDELDLNSKDSTIKVNNFALTPLVSKYDLGPAKGFQASWLNIKSDSISFDKVDFLGLINNKNFNTEIINVYKLDISVFRDKRIPFPEWQRRPLLQTTLRALNFNISIDTILLKDGFITYMEHAEKAHTTGEIFFSDMEVTIFNLTNDSIRTLTQPNMRIGLTTKVYGKGNIKGEFTFDMVNTENIHTYGIMVDPFDLTEFNRILIPSASAQISSGKNEKIIMTVKANEDYSYGEMKFYYKDLKIALLDRETETPKGVGKVLGSFFANTFFVKSNNPKNLRLRKGDVFFERDKKRAIFQYWTKSILSGMVSTIAPINHKKKIKKMQEENLKKIQAEKSLETK